MRKLATYLRYFFEYLRYWDFASIFASVKYLLNRKSHSNDRIIQTSIGKFYCRKNTNDFQFANLMYEWSVKEFLFQSLNEYSVFIDSGACIGDYCILLSKHNLRCIAFEPVPSNFSIMEKNFELNGLTGRIQTFPYGLGDQNSMVRFQFNPINTGASHIDRENSPSSISAEIRTLDSLVSQMDVSVEDRILVKLDAESMEPEAIRGSRGFIRMFPEITFVIEDKFVGRESLTSILDQYAIFEYGRVDRFNIYARKIGNLN